MGNSLGWNGGLEVSPGEQVWKACQAGNSRALKEFRKHLNDETRVHMEWRDRQTGRTPLLVAAAYGRQECLEMLIEAGADINASDTKNDGNNALHLAAINGHVKIVGVLLEADEFNPYSWNQRGCSPLDEARARYALYMEPKITQCTQMMENVRHGLLRAHACRNSASTRAGFCLEAKAKWGAS